MHRRALPPRHQPVVDQPVHESGHAALAELQVLGQDAHPEPPILGLGEQQERLVLGERQAMLHPEVLVEAAPHAGMGEHERAPRSQARIGSPERPGDGSGRGHVLIIRDDG